MVGTMEGWGAQFQVRRKREVGRDPAEAIHPSAEGQRPCSWMPWPVTRLY